MDRELAPKINSYQVAAFALATLMTFGVFYILTALLYG